MTKFLNTVSGPKVDVSNIIVTPLITNADVVPQPEATPSVIDLGDLNDGSAVSISSPTTITLDASHVSASSEYTPTFDKDLVTKDYTDLLSNASFLADSMTVNAGTLTAGTVADLTIVGGNYVEIQEASGANPLTATFHFSGVTKLSTFVFFGYYSGGSGHQLAIEVYNYTTTTWDSIGTIGAETGYKWYSFPIYNVNVYVEDTEVSIRLRHIQSGNISHNLFLDYMELNYGSTGGGTNISASSVTFIPAGNIAATNVAGAIAELDNEKQASLVSGTNIKTINSTTLLGSGDIVIEGGSGIVYSETEPLDDDVIWVDPTEDTEAYFRATQAEAEGQVNNQNYMTPLRTAQLLATLWTNNIVFIISDTQPSPIVGKTIIWVDSTEF